VFIKSRLGFCFPLASSEGGKVPHLCTEQGFAMLGAEYKMNLLAHYPFSCSLAIQQNTFTRRWFLADCALGDFVGFAVFKGGLVYHEEILVHSA
jgi:hypothetical protein